MWAESMTRKVNAWFLECFHRLLAIACSHVSLPSIEPATTVKSVPGWSQKGLWGFCEQFECAKNSTSSWWDGCAYSDTVVNPKCGRRVQEVGAKNSFYRLKLFPQGTLFFPSLSDHHPAVQLSHFQAPSEIPPGTWGLISDTAGSKERTSAVHRLSVSWGLLLLSIESNEGILTRLPGSWSFWVLWQRAGKYKLS